MGEMRERVVVTDFMNNWNLKKSEMSSGMAALCREAEDDVE